MEGIAMTTVARWARRQLRLLTPAAYRELPPGDRRGRHRAGTALGVAFELRVPTIRG
jgi:hypothetical protein